MEQCFFGGSMFCIRESRRIFSLDVIIRIHLPLSLSRCERNVPLTHLINMADTIGSKRSSARHNNTEYSQRAPNKFSSRARELAEYRSPCPGFSRFLIVDFEIVIRSILERRRRATEERKLFSQALAIRKRNTIQNGCQFRCRTA